jgi:hypothetical protein
MTREESDTICDALERWDTVRLIRCSAVRCGDVADDR